MTASRHSGVSVHAVCLIFDVEVIPIAELYSFLAYVLQFLQFFNLQVCVCVLIFFFPLF